jgi:hypothetical protein
MPEMSDTELIATRLLGFRIATEQERLTMGRPWPEGITTATYRDSGMWIGKGKFPDLANWNDIRRMEDAIREKGHADHYVVTLHKLVWLDNYEFVQYEQPDWVSIRFATQEQCVAACVRVLREVQA